MALLGMQREEVLFIWKNPIEWLVIIMKYFKKMKSWNQRQLVISLYLSTSLCRQECLVTLKSWGQGSFWKLKLFSTKKVLPQIFIISLPYLPIMAGEFLSILYTLLATLWGVSIFFWMPLLINRAGEAGRGVGRGWGSIWR